jgi:hypothetical protein
MAMFARDNFGPRHAFVFGLMGQHRACNSVADGVKACDIGGVMGIGFDRTARAHFNPQSFKPKACGIGFAPGGKQDDIGADRRLDPVGAATAAAVAAYAAQAASMSFLPKTKPYQAKRAAALALAAETERKSATAKLQRAATDSSSLASFTKAAPTPPPPVRPPAASKKAAPASPKETGTAAASAKAAAVKHAVQMNEEELRQVTFASARCVCVCVAR